MLVVVAMNYLALSLHAHVAATANVCYGGFVWFYCQFYTEKYALILGTAKCFFFFVRVHVNVCPFFCYRTKSTPASRVCEINYLSTNTTDRTACRAHNYRQLRSYQQQQHRKGQTPSFRHMSTLVHYHTTSDHNNNKKKKKVVSWGKEWTKKEGEEEVTRLKKLAFKKKKKSHRLITAKTNRDDEEQKEWDKKQARWMFSVLSSTRGEDCIVHLCSEHVDVKHGLRSILVNFNIFLQLDADGWENAIRQSLRELQKRKEQGMEEVDSNPFLRGSLKDLLRLPVARRVLTPGGNAYSDSSTDAERASSRIASTAAMFQLTENFAQNQKEALQHYALHANRDDPNQALRELLERWKVDFPNDNAAAIPAGATAAQTRPKVEETTEDDETVIHDDETTHSTIHPNSSRETEGEEEESPKTAKRAKTAEREDEESSKEKTAKRAKTTEGGDDEASSKEKTAKRANSDDN